MEIRGGDHFDRYVIESVLGRGGMGVVYLARDERLGRRVALKVLSADLAGDDSFRKRFEEEARIAASLDEPHVIPVYEAGESDGQLFLAMRYVAGFDLETLLRRQGRLEPHRAVAMIEQVAAGLDAAHAVGLVHRDVKPANVLVSSSAQGTDHVYLADFGLARSATDRGLTLAGQFVGSFDYAAPEQIQGGRIDARTDVYALGGLLFACLTGRPPFEAASDAAVLNAHLSEAPPSPSKAHAGVAEEFDAVVARAMAKDPAARHASAGDLALAARRALLGQAEVPAPSGMPETGEEPDLPRPSATRKTVTVLFADLVGSTRLGEQLDPEALRDLLRRYFETIRTIVERHGGVVEKFIGDAAMAVFGVPRVHEDDALRAVRAAVEIGVGLEALNRSAAAQLGVTLDVRTGINTGEVVAGDPASGETLVTGDPVNTAARLQQAASPGEILIGEATYRLVRGPVVVEPIAPIEAKGKDRPVAAYRLVSVGPRPTATRSATTLIGRDSEAALLLDRWQRVVAERMPRLVTILGLPGVGKSRLAQRISELVDGRVLSGRCLPYGDGITYWPIREIVYAAAGISEAEAASKAQSRIASLLAGDPQAPVLTERIATGVGLGQTDAPQAEVFWAVRRAFEEISRATPTLVVVEDLGWAEDTLLDLLEYVIDLASDAPMLILCLARPDILERRPGWSSGRPNTDLVRLEPLRGEIVLELVREQPGGGAIPETLATRICATAEGNPLFVEEMVAALRDSGDLVSRNGGAWTFTGHADRVEIPGSIRALLAARIDQLVPDERVVAERASVIGRDFETDAVSVLVPPDTRRDLVQHLRGLVRRELLQPDRAVLTGGGAFRFRHILIRDAAYDALPKADRAALHRRFAKWLESAAGDRAEEYAEILGYHLEQAHAYQSTLAVDEGRAEMGSQASRQLTIAGRRADARGDFVAATKFLGRAAILVPAGSPEWIASILALGDVQRRLGTFDAARQTFAELREAAGDDSRAAARAVTETALIDLQTADAALIEHDKWELGDMRDILRAASDDYGLSLSYMAEGAIEELEGRNASAADAFANALEYARHAGDRRAEAESVGRLLLNIILGETPVPTGIDRCEQLLTEWADQPRVLASMMDSYALLLAMAGRSTDALAAARQALTIVTELDDGLNEGLYRGQTLGVLLALAGDLPGAATEATRGCDLLITFGARAWLASAACVAGEAELAQGHVELAERWLNESNESSLASDIDAHARSAALGARLAVHHGDLAQAEHLIVAARDLVDGTELLYLRGIVAAATGCVRWAAGDAQGAVEFMREAAALHDQKGDVARARRARLLEDEPARVHQMSLA